MSNIREILGIENSTERNSYLAGTFAYPREGSDNSDIYDDKIRSFSDYSNEDVEKKSQKY